MCNRPPGQSWQGCELIHHCIRGRVSSRLTRPSFEDTRDESEGSVLASLIVRYRNQRTLCSMRAFLGTGLTTRIGASRLQSRARGLSAPAREDTKDSDAAGCIPQVPKEPAGKSKAKALPSRSAAAPKFKVPSPHDLGMHHVLKPLRPLIAPLVDTLAKVCEPVPWR